MEEPPAPKGEEEKKDVMMEEPPAPKGEEEKRRKIRKKLSSNEIKKKFNLIVSIMIDKRSIIRIFVYYNR